MKYWQVVSIPTEDEDNTLSGALGINSERVQELCQLTKNADNNSKSISEALEIVTGQCTNINEAIFVAFMYGENKGACKGCPASDMPEEIGEMIDEIAKKFGAKVGGIIEIKRRKNDDDE